MSQKPRGGIGGMALAHMVCCGGILLLATGALGGIGAWLTDGGYVWVGVAVGAVVVGALIRRRQAPPGERPREASVGRPVQSIKAVPGGPPKEVEKAA